MRGLYLGITFSAMTPIIPHEPRKFKQYQKHQKSYVFKEHLLMYTPI